MTCVERIRMIRLIEKMEKSNRTEKTENGMKYYDREGNVMIEAKLVEKERA